MSRLETEARQQAEVIGARTEPGWAAAREAAEVLNRDDVDYLVIAARGTSDNAARYAQYLLGETARLPVGLAAPWLYSSPAPPLLRRGAVMAISQSGRSPDIRSVLSAARSQGRPAIAVTNDVDSPLAVQADVVVPLAAGAERSVAATKTYLASLHAIAQIASCLHPRPDDRSWFERLPALLADAVDQQFAARARFDPLHAVTLLTVVSRGLQLATAHETALKVRELSALAAEAFSLPDLLHGPIAALRPSGAVWLVSTSGHHRPDRRTFDVLRDDVGMSIAVSDDPEVLAAADIAVEMPAAHPDWLAPMLAVIPGQAAALRLAELAGVDVDRPHGLDKVTLTR